MSFLSKKEPSRREIIEWSANQLSHRAESLEAQEVTLAAQKADWTTARILWEFLGSQWPIVVQETHRHFKGLGVVGLLKDVPAMEEAIRRSARHLFPLTYQDALPDVVEVLHRIGHEEGWNFDPPTESSGKPTEASSAPSMPIDADNKRALPPEERLQKLGDKISELKKKHGIQ